MQGHRAKARLRAGMLIGAAAAAIAAGTAAAPSTAAAETLAYRYDARGRLIHVERTGGPSNGINTAYSFDRADNRTVQNTGAGVPPPSPSSAPPPAGVSFAVNDSSVTEGSVLYFDITKSGTTTQTCTVGFRTADGTGANAAVANLDYNPASSFLPFEPTQTVWRIGIGTHTDTIAEGSETMRIILELPDCGATISDSEGIGTINDP